MLSVKNLTVRYDSLEAVTDVSMDIAEGTVVSLLGSNGSGKSTILKAISGLKAAASGEITFEGKRIDGLPVSKILKLGIALVPEGRRLFPRMTVKENLELGAYTRSEKSAIIQDIEENSRHFPVLKERSRHLARTLSGGVQEMLAIARALMTKPRLLLMDEPAQGLSPLVIREVETIIKELNARGITILLVEHNVRLALGLAHKVYILETGRLVFEGTQDVLSQNDYVKRVYLGG